jgi:hypothetical protein
LLTVADSAPVAKLSVFEQSTQSTVSVQYTTLFDTAGVKTTVMCAAFVPNFEPAISIRFPDEDFAILTDVVAVTAGAAVTIVAAAADADFTPRTATTAFSVPAVVSDKPTKAVSMLDAPAATTRPFTSPALGAKYTLTLAASVPKFAPLMDNSLMCDEWLVVDAVI